MITIERAGVEDVDSIRRVLSETWMDTYGRHLSRAAIERVTTLWHDAELLRSQIERPGDYFAVARAGGKIVGLITVVVVGEQELHLPRLYVHPEHQRRGIGSALLNAALARYPAAHTIRLEVERRNAKGLSYWLEQHFVEVGTRTERVGTDEIPVVVMERKLR
jgi:ribosomal protein S18 acetylase RimI-like enzyme